MTDNRTTVSSFRFLPPAGGTAEYHFMIRVADSALSFSEQLEAVMDAYRMAVDGRTVLFRRFFLSDPANQAGRLGEALAVLPAAATSLVGQPPLDGTKLALWAYAVDGPAAEGALWAHNGYTHVWHGHMLSGMEGSEAQMSELFSRYDGSLHGLGLSVADDCIRTWIFVRDVDTNYSGVVKGRKDYFEGIGLTPDTHFIASTGICGVDARTEALVNMDAYAVGGLLPGQVSYLHAYDHLSPTALYGVTFERGTAVTYGDRRHVFISGTASIDSEGKVVHEGDPARQTERLLENVGALLGEAGAGFEDIAYSIVYLRDIADFETVRRMMKQLHPGLQPVYVLAPVCRPAWLVEMECMAVVPASEPWPAF